MLTIERSISAFDSSSISLAEFIVLYYGYKSGLWMRFVNNRLSVNDSVLSESDLAILNAAAAYDLIKYRSSEEVFEFGHSLAGEVEHIERWLSFIGSFGWYVQNVMGVDMADETWKNITTLCMYMAEDFEEVFFKLAPELLNGQVSVLDIGCGRFFWGQRILKENPNSLFSAIDSSPVVAECVADFFVNYPQYKNRFQFESRGVDEFIESDILFDHTPFDAVILSHILHWLTKEQIKSLFHRMSDLISSEAKIYVFEDYIAEHDRFPKSSYKKKAIQKLYGYDVYSEDEIDDIVSEEGYKVSRAERHGDRRIFIVIEKK